MRRSVTTTVAGSILVLCGALASGAVLMTPEPYWSRTLLVCVAGLTGTGAVIGALPELRRPGAAVGSVLAAHVAGHGTVGIRDLFNAQGAGLPGLAQHELASRVALAAVVALAGTVALCVAVALLWREPRRGWAALRPRRARLLAAGVAIMLVSITPGLLAGIPAEMLTGAGEGLLYLGLPCGGGLAGAAWLGPRARRAATVPVVLSMTVTTISITTELSVAALSGWP
jgi:hypothetical protein